MRSLANLSLNKNLSHFYGSVGCDNNFFYIDFQLHGVDANVGRSKNIIISMARRPDRNKWTIGLLITVLLIAIVVILYFKLWH